MSGRPRSLVGNYRRAAYLKEFANYNHDFVTNYCNNISILLAFSNFFSKWHLEKRWQFASDASDDVYVVIRSRDPDYVGPAGLAALFWWRDAFRLKSSLRRFTSSSSAMSVRSFPSQSRKSGLFQLVEKCINPPLNIQTCQQVWSIFALVCDFRNCQFRHIAADQVYF